MLQRGPYFDLNCSLEYLYMLQHIAENYGARYQTVATELRDVIQSIWAAHDVVGLAGHNDKVELPGLRILKGTNRFFPEAEPGPLAWQAI